jgi:hypothetical protein
MSDKKKKIAFFTIPEYKKEEEWLRENHRSGLKLVKATLPCFYTFEKCDPQDVVYQLDYNEEGMKNKEEYVKMYEDCGWEYITDMAGYSYFRKPVSEMLEDEEIFSDDQSKIDMIERVFKGKMIPLLTILFLIIIPQLFLQGSIDHILNHILFGFFLVMLILYAVLFIKFAIQYINLKRHLKD